MKKHMDMRRRGALSGLMFVAPWILGVTTFFIVPFIKSILYSFSKITFTAEGLETTFHGVKNYAATFLDDPDNGRLILESVRDMVFNVVVIVVFSLLIAIVLAQKFRGRLIARAVFAMPVIISSGVIIMILKNDVLNQSMASGGASIFQSSQIFTLLIETGLPQDLVEFFTGIVNGIFDLVWKSGMQIILFLAALQSVPDTSYEAARIEGATAWESFWFITFPMVSPFLLINVIYSIIDTFTDSNNAVMYKVYSLITTVRYEPASALSTVYFLIVLAVTGLAYALLSRRVFYLEK